MPQSNDEVFIPWDKDMLYRQLAERGLHAHELRKRWGVSPDFFTMVLERDKAAGYIRVPRTWAFVLANYMGVSINDLLQQVEMKTFLSLSEESGADVATLLAIAREEGIRIENYMGVAAFRGNTPRGKMLIEAAMETKEFRPMNDTTQTIVVEDDVRFLTYQELGFPVGDKEAQLALRPFGTAEERRKVALSQARKWAAMSKDGVEMPMVAYMILTGVSNHLIMGAAKAGRITLYKARKGDMDLSAWIIRVDERLVALMEGIQWRSSPGARSGITPRNHPDYSPKRNAPKHKPVLKTTPKLKSDVVHFRKVGFVRRMMRRFFLGIE